MFRQITNNMRYKYNLASATVSLVRLASTTCAVNCVANDFIFRASTQHYYIDKMVKSVSKSEKMKKNGEFILIENHKKKKLKHHEPFRFILYILVRVTFLTLLIPGFLVSFFLVESHCVQTFRIHPKTTCESQMKRSPWMSKLMLCEFLLSYL